MWESPDPVAQFSPSAKSFFLLAKKLFIPNFIKIGSDCDELLELDIPETPRNSRPYDTRINLSKQLFMGTQ